MSRQIKLVPVVQIQIGYMVDDGSPVTLPLDAQSAGLPMAAAVPLGALAGSQFYADLMCKIAQAQAQLDTEDAMREAIDKVEPVDG